MKHKKGFCGTVLSLLLAVLLGCTFAAGGFLECEAALNDLQAEVVQNLPENEDEYRGNTLVLENTTPSRAAELAERFDAKLRITADGTFATLTLPEGMSIKDVLSARENRDVLREISVDTVCEFPMDREVTEASQGFGDAAVTAPTPQWPQYTVTDSGYSNQVNLKYVGLENVWQTTRGKFANGNKVKVAIVDTGIDIDHPEFYDANGNFIVSPDSYNAFTDISVASGGWSVIDDKRGHGTAVAGVIAAQMNGVGMVGIAPEVELLIIRAENEEGKFYSSDMTFGINYAVEKGAHVVSMSISGTGRNTGTSLQNAVNNNVIVVCSAGNEGDANVRYPASDPLCIGVGALGYNSWNLASYSSYGVNSDLVAPGTSIYTTAVGGGYKYINGTSFSCPTVAAAVALYISVHGVTSYATLREQLLLSCDDLGEEGEDEYFGHGALNIHNFVDFDSMSKIIFNFRLPSMTQQVTYADPEKRISLPIPQSQDGLQFEGWYLDERLTQKVSGTSHTFAQDTMLYARWLGVASGDFDYQEYSPGEAKILAYRGNAQTLQIPETLDGKKVKIIDYQAFAGNTTLREVTIPEGIYSISTGAFTGCTSLNIVRIYSANVLSRITQNKSPGDLCRYASTVLVPSSLSFDDENLTKMFGYTAAVESGGVAYVKYSDHESIWVNGATLAQHIPCVQDGVLEVTCSQCGYTGEARTSMHTDGAWGVQTPPLCLTKGTEVQRCALCQAYLRSREIPATGHTMDKGVTVAPKCEEMGYLLRTCQDCGDEKKSKFVEATGHLSSDWVLTCQPTKRVEGEEQRSCVHCNKLLETRSVAPYTYLIAFETKVTALTGACDTDSYNEIIARLNYYYKLSAEMQAVVREDYEKLCAAIELYNAGAEAHNAKLVQGEVEAQARDSRELLENTEELMEGLWYSLFDKTRERGVTV